MQPPFNNLDECKVAFDKAKRLIEERKKQFNRIPEIQEFDNGNILIQFFEHWDIYWNDLKKRNFESVQHDDKSIVAIFAEGEKFIEIGDLSKEKTYVVINGDIEISFFDNSPIKRVGSFQSITIPKDFEHKLKAIRDTYVIVITN